MGDAAGDGGDPAPDRRPARRRCLQPVADRPRADPARRSAPAPPSTSPAPPGRSPARSPRSIRSARAISPPCAAPPTAGAGDGPAQIRLISALLAPRPERRGAGPRAAGSRPTIPARPRSISWSATRSACAAILPPPPSNIAAPPTSPSPKRVAMRLIDSLQRSGQARRRRQRAQPVRPAESAQRPRPDPARRAGDAAAGTGRSRSRSTRACARASATMTRPSSTTSPGPIRKAATMAARCRSPAAPGRSTATIRPPPTRSAGSCSRAAAAPKASPCSQQAARGAPSDSDIRRRLAEAARRASLQRLTRFPAEGGESPRCRGCSSAMRDHRHVGWSRRSRSRNCEASPTMTMVAPSGASSSARRGLRLGRGHRQHRTLVADAARPDRCRAARRRR